MSASVNWIAQRPVVWSGVACLVSDLRQLILSSTCVHFSAVPVTVMSVGPDALELLTTTGSMVIAHCAFAVSGSRRTASENIRGDKSLDKPRTGRVIGCLIQARYRDGWKSLEEAFVVVPTQLRWRAV
jgi:hypothetical protein